MTGEQQIVASGGSQLDALFQRIEGMLAGVAVGALTVAIIIIGFKIMFAIRNGDNVRMAIQNMGVVAFAALLIGGASGIAALLNAVGKQIGG
ncbi:TrbC/VirB2 family protein [Actinopolymorpha sp. B17G11]|uniref:TrbC/VirB2 family protein n=1 Tax=Actinopolymorpha sp. B17G11 TaxID=3160861 RepID=UPI0032E3DB2E